MKRIFAGIAIAAALQGICFAGEAEKEKPAPAPASGAAAEAEAAKPAGANGQKQIEHYDGIITKNPFSPKMYLKPAPKEEKPPAKPRTRIIIKVSNLTLTGVVWDRASGKYQAMMDVSGGPGVFLPEGSPFRKIRIESVAMDGVEITDHEGARKKIALGQSFHDGETVREEWTGGEEPQAPDKASSAAAPSDKPAAPGQPAMSDDKRKEIEERLRAKRKDTVK